MIGVIDAGTTTIKLAVYDEDKLVAIKKEPVVKHNPKPGWVEIDAEDLAKKCLSFADTAIDEYGVEVIAITNQRTTAVLWDGKTGRPVFNALGWQDMRANALAEEMNRDSTIRMARTAGMIARGVVKLLPTLKNKRRVKWLITLSRLSIRPNHTSVKLCWMLRELGEKKEKYDLKAGTVDSWLVYRLTGEHLTDYSNAAATGLYDSYYLRWSEPILKIVGADEEMLPKTLESDRIFGEYRNVPVTGVIADQSASLYALGCWEEGDIKATNGTGTFVDLNVGEEPQASPGGLLPLIAWKLKSEMRYMMEGMLFYSGSAVEKLKEIGIYDDVSKTSEMAFRSKNDDMLLIPSFTGLATPHYVSVPGLLYGISNAMTREDIVKALLESIAFRIAEIVEIMRKEFPYETDRIRCDGEMSSNDFFLQRIADVTGLKVERGAVLSGTSFGAHLVAGRALGKWKKDFCMPFDKVFEPSLDLSEKYRRWKRLLEISKKLKV
ncbi:FGGY family carbohydrate kinase [Archaeoglobus fulgidus]|uniref:FGGY family carbohydrate kinase n=1 Tax=Archaeoglobus fulgidus TaxID=2234 RepID=UPI000B3608A5|nr:FGGY family carbohydrate kinase [Archaeoglobus fulgidus]